MGGQAVLVTPAQTVTATVDPRRLSNYLLLCSGLLVAGGTLLGYEIKRREDRRKRSGRLWLPGDGPRPEPAGR